MYSVMMKKAIDILKRVILVSYQNISRDQKYMYNHRDNFIDFKLCDISVTESLRRNLFCYIIIVLTCSISEYYFAMDKKVNSTSASILILCFTLCFCKLTLSIIKFLYNHCFFSSIRF